MNARPIVPWQGGKRRLAKEILPLFGPHKTYVEPFCGGAAMFFYKEPSQVEVLNDINGELMNLYRVVKNNLEEFLAEFEWALISREEYYRHKNTDPVTLNEVQRAARFYYLQKMAFGGSVLCHNFGVSVVCPPKFNLLSMEESLAAARLRLARVYIEHVGWADCVAAYDGPETLFYLDPPYWGTGGYGKEFDFEQYQIMAEQARIIEGRMVISVNDIPEMREIFEGLQMLGVEAQYTSGQEKSYEAKELLIFNREPQAGANNVIQLELVHGD